MNILAAGVLTLFLIFNSKMRGVKIGARAEDEYQWYQHTSVLDSIVLDKYISFCDRYLEYTTVSVYKWQVTALEGSVSIGGGQVGGDVSGGVSGNFELPENILTECSVGGSVDANANADESTSGGVQGNAEVNVDINLPSCDCVRKFDVEGSASVGGVEGSAGGSVSGSVSLAMPGVNCVEDTPDEETDTGYSYIVDILRDSLFCPPNDFIDASQTTGNAPIEYLQTMDENNSLEIYGVDITVGKRSRVYEVKNGDKMLAVCDNSYPEKSVEANIWKILNLSIMDGKGCPVEKGDGYIIPAEMKSVTLSFDKPIPCGNYTFHINIDTSKNSWVLGLKYKWTIEKGLTECTDEIEQLD